MRLALRSLVMLAAAVVTHCAMPAPAFAQDGVAPSAESWVHAAPAQSVPDAPSPPVPAAPDAVALAEETASAPRRTDEIVDAWFAKHFHGLGAHLSEYLYNHIRTAIEDLKTLLLELPIS